MSDNDPIDLTKAEQRVALAGLIVVTLGEVGARVIDNLTGNWWPALGLVISFGAFALGFTAYLAHTRQRSFASVVMTGLPQRWRRRRNRTQSQE